MTKHFWAKSREGFQKPGADPKKDRLRNIAFDQCCGAEAGGAEFFWDLEPEPKLNF